MQKQQGEDSHAVSHRKSAHRRSWGSIIHGAIRYAIVTSKVYHLSPACAVNDKQAICNAQITLLSLAGYRALQLYRSLPGQGTKLESPWPGVRIARDVR